MPTYEYACKQCGEHLEVVQSFQDEPLSECPRCGGELRKVFGSIGIVFKGSGFYKTDSRASSSESVGRSHGSGGSEAASAPASTSSASTSTTGGESSSPSSSTAGSAA